MVVLTIIFLTLSLATLLKGRLFNGLYTQIIEEDIKMNTDEKYKLDGGFLVKILLFILYGIVLFIVQLIYLSNALDYDVYKYPTLAMLLLVVFTFIKPLLTSKKKKVYDEATINKEREKTTIKYTFKGIVRSLINIAYYSYILYLLVF